MTTTSHRRKNKHGRTGARKHTHAAPVPAQADPNSAAYQVGYRAGSKAANAARAAEQKDFLRLLASKRNRKDIIGLIEQRLETL